MSKIEVDAIEPQSGTSLTLGASGDTITIPSGATLSSTDPLVFPAGTVSLPAITTSGDTNTGIFFPSADTIAFTEGGTEAMRINSSGNVGIKAINPLGTLHVNGSIVADTGAGNGYGFERSSVKQSVLELSSVDVLSLINPLTNILVFGTSNIERMRLTSGGALSLAGSTAQKASGTTWSNPSDTRLKDNKQNYTKGLNELLQINVKTWEWNGKAGTTQGDVGIGIIADEIETILPNTIDTYKAKLNEDDIEETDVKRFDATEITWLLLNSVKEQQSIIEELKATSTSQQSKIDALEAKITTLENN
jgi:hypothetical protein